MDWTTRKYAVHLQMDGLLIKGLKWCLNCIKISYRIRGSIIITYHYHHHHRHRHRLSLLPITITYHRHPSLLPTTDIYHYCLPIRAIAH